MKKIFSNMVLQHLKERDINSGTICLAVNGHFPVLSHAMKTPHKIIVNLKNSKKQFVTRFAVIFTFHKCFSLCVDV